MTVPFKIGVFDLVFEFFAHTFIFFCPFSATGAVAACFLQTFFDGGNHRRIGIQSYFHTVTSFSHIYILHLYAITRKPKKQGLLVFYIQGWYTFHKGGGKMKPTEKENRILWPDLLRVIAIFAVVMLHSFTGNFSFQDSAWHQAASNSADWQILNIFDCCLRFCVPVFCMISGIFFLRPDREQPLKKLFSKNILRMAIVFVVWAGIYAVFANILRAGTFNFAVVKAIIKDMAFGHYHLWFLLMILGFYLAVPLLRKITADQKTTQYFLLLWVIFTVLQNAVILLPPVANFIEIQAGKMSLLVAAGYAGYFVLGQYLYQYPPTKTVRHLVYIGGVFSLAVTVLFTALGGLNGQKLEGLYGYILPNTVLQAAALFLFVRQRLEHKTLSEKSAKIIGFLSSVSFGVYLTHDLFNLILHKLGFTALSFTPLLSVPLLTLLVSGCAIGLTVLLKKIPKWGDYLL